MFIQVCRKIYKVDPLWSTLWAGSQPSKQWRTNMRSRQSYMVDTKSTLYGLKSSSANIYEDKTLWSTKDSMFCDHPSRSSNLLDQGDTMYFKVMQ